MAAPITTKLTRTAPIGCEISSQQDTSRQATLTNEASKTSGQTTCADINNATSSQESEAGRWLSATQDSWMRHGQDRRLASRLARRERAAQKKTQDIYGLNCIVSSESAALQSCLESRLKRQLDTDGSIECTLIWKAKITPLRRRYCQLLARARHKLETGFTLWPRPQARETGSGRGYQRRPDGKVHPMLTGLVGVASFPTSPRTEIGAVLSQDLSRWLMGFPRQWSNCAPTVTRSSRKSRQPSSARACEPLPVRE
jgi:hypothetical protein